MTMRIFIESQLMNDRIWSLQNSYILFFSIFEEYLIIFVNIVFFK
jgi:hypothetical protein